MIAYILFVHSQTQGSPNCFKTYFVFFAVSGLTSPTVQNYNQITTSLELLEYL